MMKISILFFSTFLLFGNIETQQSNKFSGSLKISAKILEATSKQPIEYATVTLLNDSSKKVVNGGISNKKGAIELQNITPANYQLLVQFLGYEAFSQKINLKADMVLVEVLLHKKSVELNNVTVSSTTLSHKVCK